MTAYKYDYTFSTVYYSDLDSGERTSVGLSLKSYQIAVKEYNNLWGADGLLKSKDVSLFESIIRHLICSLKKYKYNQDSKLLLNILYKIIEKETIAIDSSLNCKSVKNLLNSNNDYIY